jgi:hypothetical protein
MTIHIVNYASGRFLQAQQLQNAKWREFHLGADLIIHSYQRSSLPSDHLNDEIRKVLAIPKGDGLWAWKALCISHVYDHAQQGDLVFYMDSGANPTQNLAHVFNEIVLHGNVFVRVPGFDEEEETRRWLRTIPLYSRKRDLIEQPNLFLTRKWDKRLVANPDGAVQVCGGFQGYVVCERNTRFLEQLRSMITLANYDEVTNIQHSDYIDHRHDQAVLTEMAYKQNMHVVDRLPGILLHRANS